MDSNCFQTEGIYGKTASAACRPVLRFVILSYCEQPHCLRFALFTLDPSCKSLQLQTERFTVLLLLLLGIKSNTRGCPLREAVTGNAMHSEQRMALTTMFIGNYSKKQEHSHFAGTPVALCLQLFLTDKLVWLQCKRIAQRFFCGFQTIIVFAVQLNCTFCIHRHHQINPV